MRAMGHKVTQPQLDEIFSLCDPHGLGEIDFESFCTNVLGYPADRALRLARAHLDQPVHFDPPSTEVADPLPSVLLDQLLPNLYARVVRERVAADSEEPLAVAGDGSELPLGSHKEEEAAAAAAAAATTTAPRREALYVWQDFGQYTRSQLNSERIGRTDLLRILSRPFAITMHKGAIAVCFAGAAGPHNTSRGTASHCQPLSALSWNFSPTQILR
jgi:hypothetical protein